MSATKKLHDLFQERFGATCCRVSTKKVRYGSKAHFHQCAPLTGMTARMAAKLILDKKPEIAEQSDYTYLEQGEQRVVSQLKRAADLIR